ncbi:MAG TPA: hypothetical protein DIV86_02225 [Alphaproteobacteria bacterium]|nr:hypothetical protein [Alphaproteobacteria bacterium]
MNYAKKISEISNSESVYFLRLKDENTYYWHYIKVPKIKESLLKKLEQGSEIDVATLGHILESGYGFLPSDEVIKKYEAVTQ